MQVKYCCQEKCFNIPNEQVDGLACWKCYSYNFCRCRCISWDIYCCENKCCRKKTWGQIQSLDCWKKAVCTTMSMRLYQSLDNNFYCCKKKCYRIS